CCVRCDTGVMCRVCCREAHATLPLHTLQVSCRSMLWLAKATLREIGFVYQMGHGGNACEVPAPEISSLMVMCDKSGNHFLNLRYCNCGKYGLDGATKPGQWLQIRRHGWFASTSKHPGACATFRVLPDVDRLGLSKYEMPDSEWERAKTSPTNNDKSLLAPTTMSNLFIYLFDAHAMLRALRTGGGCPSRTGKRATSFFSGAKNLGCSFSAWNAASSGMPYPPCITLCARPLPASECRGNVDDPSLGPGWGAFVEPRRYKKHLRKYISTCIAFAALTQKETRNTAGLRVSGVGGCVCARHECIHPNDLGGLQKGEQYANRDYILVSALREVDLMEYTVSYDIACQWKKNFKAHMEKLPKALQRDFNEVLMQSGLPVWHALAHEEDCTNENNLALLPGVGKSDGEGIERLWAHLNGFQTKEMSVGNRADTIEDRLDSHNFLKNLDCQGDALRRRLVMALAERTRQVDAFKEINKTIHSGKRVEWQAQIDTYLKDRSVPNPYLRPPADGPTEAEIRVMLKKEEQAEAVAGDAPLHATSEMAFLTAGLQLENTQRRIKAGIAATTHLTTDCAIKVEEHRLAFFAKLRPFRTLQEVYMPGAAHMLARDAEAHADDAPAPAAERVRLWLPSGLPDGERASGCQRNLPEMEARLRESQCTDALSAIRLALHSKRHLLTFRHDNIGGQIRQTRSHSIVDQLSIRIDALAAKYTEARAALSALKAEEYAPHLKKLVKADLRLEAEGKENDTEADRSDRAGARKLGKIGGRPLREVGKSSVLFWIWTARGALDDNEAPAKPKYQRPLDQPCTLNVGLSSMALGQKCTTVTPLLQRGTLGYKSPPKSI
ncbi:hypothetical protein C8F04DRAFT_948131, partial [Mycena alexandri]